MEDRRRIVIWAILALGLVLAFGGFVVGRQGSVVSVFPMWAMALGLFILDGALYLWYLNRDSSRP